MIRDKIDKILDCLPEIELNYAYWSIVRIQEEFLFRKTLDDKGVKITDDVLKESEEIIELWDKTFAHNVSRDIKESIYYNQYKWHIFSFEKQDCLKGEEAKQAFDAITKDELYVFYQSKQVIEQYQNAKSLVAVDFDSRNDIYIFDINFTWTYVHTHESNCGPYFYKLNV